MHWPAKRRRENCSKLLSTIDEFRGGRFYNETLSAKEWVRANFYDGREKRGKTEIRSIIYVLVKDERKRENDPLLFFKRENRVLDHLLTAQGRKRRGKKNNLHYSLCFEVPEKGERKGTVACLAR